MIFRFVKIYKNVKEGTKNPTGFAHDEALGLLRGAIVPVTAIGAVAVVIFFLLGFSEFWFGPSGFFKVVSIICSIAWFMWFVITQIVLMVAKNILKKAKQHIDAKVFEHDVTPR